MAYSSAMKPSLPVVLVLMTTLAACSSTGGTSSGSSPAASSSAAAPASAASSEASSSAAAAPASGASLDMTLTDMRMAGPLGRAVTAQISGNVPQLRTGDGQLVSAADTEPMGTHITWGDGAEDGSDAGDVQCTTSGVLVKLDQQFSNSHTYAKAGTYKVTFTVGACPPLKDLTKTLMVTVG